MFCTIKRLYFYALLQTFFVRLKNPHSRSLLMRGKIVTLCSIFLYLIYTKHRKLKKVFYKTLKYSRIFPYRQRGKFQSLHSVKNSLKCNFENMQFYKFFHTGYIYPLRVTLIYESCNLQ